MITAIKLQFSRQAPFKLNYSERDPSRTGPIKVFLPNEKRRNDQQVVTITIPPKTSQTFGTGELWLEKVNDPGKERLTSVKLPQPEDAFEVVFRPKEDNKISYHDFELDLSPVPSGLEYVPTDGRVQLYYNAPKIDIPKPLATVWIQSGAEADMERYVGIDVGLAGRDGVKRTVLFECMDQRKHPESPRFMLKGGGPASEDHVFEDITLEPYGAVELSVSRTSLLSEKPCGSNSRPHATFLSANTPLRTGPSRPT